MNEFLFTCELCYKQFPADPETMLECKAEFIGNDPITGESRPLNQEEQEALSQQMEFDPEISPFLKGAICVCHECQDRWEEDSELLR